MATTSWKSPGTIISSARTGGDVSWVNPSNAGASDNTYATASLTDAGPDSHWLWCTNFGFTESDIPAGATINGIEVRWERKGATGLSGEGTTKITYYKLIKAGAETGTQKTENGDLPASDTVSAIQGGAADMWSASYTAAEAIASDTGIAIAYSNDAYTTFTASADHVEMRWTYTAAGGATRRRCAMF